MKGKGDRKLYRLEHIEIRERTIDYVITGPESRPGARVFQTEKMLEIPK